MQDKDLWSY